MSGLADLRRQAEQAPVLDLCPQEPHTAGMVLGVLSVAGGVAASRAGSQALAWVALLGVGVAMLLYQRWRVPGPGWRVDFARRRVEPVGQAGEAVELEGRGWSLRTAAGDKFGQVAIDLMHEDRGRVVRLLEQMALIRWRRHHLFALADVLARRLDVPRTREG